MGERRVAGLAAARSDGVGGVLENKVERASRSGVFGVESSGS